MTDHIGAFDRLYSKLASVDNLAVTISNFSSITAQAITISKTSPLLNITDQASLNTFSLAVAAISGDFFTDSQSGDVIIKSQSPTKRLLLGSGPSSDIIFDGGLIVKGGGGPTAWTSLFSGGPTNSGLATSTEQNGFNFGWNVTAGQGENVMTYFTGAGASPRLDICSWDGSTRTTTLSINRTGGVTFGTNLYPNNRGTNNQVLTTNGSGTLSWQSVAGTGGGTVNSVALTAPSFLTVTGSPITSAGTLAITASSTGTGAVVLASNPTLSGTTLNGTTTVTGALVGNTGGDFTISTPNNFLFLNAAYSIRSGGLAIHQEASNNQTFSGTVTGDQTIRSDSNVWLGTDVLGKKVNLRAPAGIFAGNRRLDLSNFGIYEGASPLPDSAWNPYIPPNELQTIGTPLSFNNTNGRFTNQTGFRVLVTANYSLKRASNGFGQTLFRIALDNGFFVARNTVAALDEATGSFQFVLNDQDGFVFEGFQNSGSGNNFAASCIVSYTYVFT